MDTFKQTVAELLALRSTQAPRGADDPHGRLTPSWTAMLPDNQIAVVAALLCATRAVEKQGTGR